MDEPLPLGKLPPDLLANLIAGAPCADRRVLLGPGLGLDCAVLDLGERLLVFKSDPITFATQEIGWYAVQVNANDIATCGAQPRWLLHTLLLPEGSATPGLARQIMEQVHAACRDLGIAVIGGHTEVTAGLDRPIISATLVGEVLPARLVTPRGAQPGDSLLLTKGVPIEAACLLAREFPARLAGALSAEEIAAAAGYLHDPGISVLRDAQAACAAGRVHAMHDPTEGGLAAALWELAQASGCDLWVDPAEIPVLPLAERICRAFGMDPLASIASGALLLAVEAGDAAGICRALQDAGIACRCIGAVQAGSGRVFTPRGEPLPRPARDEITRAYEDHSAHDRAS